MQNFLKKWPLSARTSTLCVWMAKEEQVSEQAVWSPMGVTQAWRFPTRKLCNASIRNCWSCEREVFTSCLWGTRTVKQSFENLSLKKDCCVGCFCFCLFLGFFTSFLRSHMYRTGSVVFYRLKSRVNFWSFPRFSTLNNSLSESDYMGLPCLELANIVHEPWEMPVPVSLLCDVWAF